ncbi:MAG: transcription-repair coupling factor [Acidimicrobiales bacterium]|nr:transcription-repair coupling factor [Actinomycetota bacterium]MDP7208291.1 transcription-repair coupling factor [Acidimicrobiales bacterium]
MSGQFLSGLPDLLEDEPALASVLGRRHATLAVPEPARAIVLAAVARQAGRYPLVVAVPTGSEAEFLAADLRLYLGHDNVELFPAWETLPFERVSPGVETMGRRLHVLHRLSSLADRPQVVVASGRALVQRLGPGAGDVEPILIGPGDVVDQTLLVSDLVAAGYRREYQVEHRGEVAVRGSIVDVWPSTSEAPVRIDLWGDEVDRLCEFGVADQLATISRAEVEILPCRELILDGEVRERAAALVGEQPWGREQWDRLSSGELFDGMESWLPWLSGDERVLFDLLDDDSLVVALEPRRLRDRIADLQAEEESLADTLAVTWGADVDDFPRLHTGWDRLLVHTNAPVWTLDAVPEGPGVETISASGWHVVPGAVDTDSGGVVGRLASLLADGIRVVVVADGEGSVDRLSQRLLESGIEAASADSGTDLRAGGARLVVAPLERGFVLPSSGLAVVTEAEITGRRRTRRRTKPRRTAAVRVFEDLAPGDYVVHEHHGVARFAGLVTRTLGGVERDYLLLEYRGDDRLYLPTDQIDVIRPHTGGEKPSLSRMGGSDWQKAKSKVRSAVDEIAQELVLLYQQRVVAAGHAFAADTPWQRELEQSFPYQETADQLGAIEDVKADMERALPMDRLVCGDVGFGKTEVAVRAVFKAVQDGRQAAILVPTTLLAQQHGQTFRDRYAPYPVRVEVLSRFLTPAEARRVAEGLADGSVDVVIGTHRLLSGDIVFKNLGLLVIDEEQHFGVSHKESIKALRSDVDVLTLTATPIPRTLEMSLTGIRDLSLLNTPPADRQPILTYVGGYDERAVAEAIRRELLRDGQVFFVHNRVYDIDQIAGGIRELVPEARVAVAHGQMDEVSLENIVMDFWEGRYDVLVCTTIIESGIDMPTVNTLVVDRADLLGLGQMHQLRGRVGRAGQRAYAYLFTPPDRSLSEEAYERLRTIGETTDLGSGFRIAMRDLEIRGAGNLLGTGQSGHVAAVGYDLYCQMVTEAVDELAGRVPEVPAEIRVEVPVDAHLPEDYVSRSDLRLEAYRKLAAAGTTPDAANVEAVRSEWEDRYGPLPPAAEALIAVGRLRALCVERGMTDVTVGRGPGLGGPERVARCSPVVLPLSRQTRLARLHHHAVYKEGSRQLILPVDGDDLVGDLVSMIEDLIPVEAGSVGQGGASPTIAGP